MDDYQQIAKLKAKVDAAIKAMDTATLKTRYKEEASLRKFVRDLCLELAKGIGIGLGRTALESLIQFGVHLIQGIPFP
ncbi:hypothetical protein [Sphaerospermopsis sp. FACHB-1194]|uniref:hypothetical protein n=2 Tax=Sphaerospermopsis TaxID=752201 RepID=UPI00168163C5|nr:hypothetical protein [Sphaerospermopsis sp. FACHB-1194]MBD2147597.1 hypothetical protein [Sphaerospermopsis sp. FACHB-1194]